MNSPNFFFSIRPKVIKLFSCSIQLSTKFIMLIHVKMPTIVGILTFISMINITSERLKARNFFIWWHFSFYEHLKFRSHLSWAWKKFYNLRARIVESIWAQKALDLIFLLFVFSVKWSREVILLILCVYRCEKILLFPWPNEEGQDQDSRHPRL